MLAQSRRISAIYLKEISLKGLKSIASHCGPSLQILVAEVDGKAIKLIQSICQACPNLTVLRLENFVNNASPDKLILTAVRYCPRIRVLPSALLELTDVAVSVLASLHTLTELKLNRYDSDDSESIQRVLQANPHLTWISLDGGYIDASLVSCIARCCGELERLELMKGPFTGGDPVDINTLFSNALLDLFRGCTHLEEFTLHQASEFTGELLRALFRYCPMLTSLDLFINSATPPSTGPVLDASYPTLSKLSVQGYGVAESAVRDMFTHCTNLQEVTLRNYKQATDATIRILLQRCTKLNTLLLWFCTNMTINAMLYVATHCPTLKFLVCGNMPVNDEVLAYLSASCPGLTMLILQYCHSGPITEVGVLGLAERCSGMTHLCIHGNLLEPLTPTLNRMKRGELYKHILFDCD